MGCDIHMHVEVNKTIRDSDKWICGDLYAKNPYYEIDSNENEFEYLGLYEDRNYTLFALLADVRNYGENSPISQPKGLPSDCCNEIQCDYEIWECDAHSASYFTLKELIDYEQKKIKTKYSGMVSFDVAERLDNEREFPRSWCQATNREGWVYREWEKKESPIHKLIKLLEERRKIFYIKNPEDIRIVFWFDN